MRFIDTVSYVSDKEVRVEYCCPNVCVEINQLLATSGDYEKSKDGHFR